MDNSALRDQAFNKMFPFLVDEKDGCLDNLLEKSQLISLDAKQKVLMQGSLCKDYLLVVEGSMRVQFLTRSGREVVLYHVNSGEDCVLTTSCLFANDGFPAEGITETEMSVIAIPAEVFHQTLQDSAVFRQFVFSTFGKRLTEVISRMEILCTASIEHQLAKALLFLGKENSTINMTHQELASEVGTVREVVSRHLKKFEKSEWIQLSRGCIRLIDTTGLQAIITK